MIRTAAATAVAAVLLASSPALAHTSPYCGHGTDRHGDRKTVFQSSFHAQYNRGSDHRHWYREYRFAFGRWVGLVEHHRGCPTH